MRAPFLMLPITLALAAPLPGFAEEAPHVIFCSGDCYAVDAQGARTPAPKGTRLLPGQRLETGSGSYAQVKLGADVAFGVGEKARVRLERNGVFLDEGRIRVVGEQHARPVELRTEDSTFVLRGADIEMKKSGPTGPASPVLVKLNAGDASVSGAALTNGGVQLVTAGSVIPGAPLPSTDVAPDSTLRTDPVAQAPGAPAARPRPFRVAPVSLPPVSLPPVAKAPIVPPTLVLPPAVRLPVAPPPRPVLSGGERLLVQPVLNTRTGDIITLTDAIKLTIDPTITVKTISPTISTTSLSTTTLSKDTTVFTTTKLPTTTTTTTTPTTTFKLISPTFTTIRR